MFWRRRPRQFFPAERRRPRLRKMWRTRTPAPRVVVGCGAGVLACDNSRMYRPQDKEGDGGGLSLLRARLLGENVTGGDARPTISYYL